MVLALFNIIAALLPLNVNALRWATLSFSAASLLYETGKLVSGRSGEIFNIGGFIFGNDGISNAYIWLTCFIFLTSFLMVWGNTSKPTLMLFLLSLIQLLLIGAFMCYDLLMFYILSESILIPMFLIIGIWGSRQDKVKAAYYFFFYTLIGSVSFIIAIIYLQIQFGSTNILLFPVDNEYAQKLLWPLFFIAFSVKLPMFPFHVWLPEAHVEAPTVGSVILAALLLKLGSFGYIRFMLPVFSKEVQQFYWPAVVCLAGCSIIFASVEAIRQIDMKRIIAYSSIAHMNLAVLGLFSGSVDAINGGIFITVSHGFVSAGMFALIGVYYDRYHSRLVTHYAGLARTMPLYAIIFIIFTLANIGFPLSFNFLGELSVTIALMRNFIFAGMIGLLSILLGVVYAMWLANRILFGDSSSTYLRQSYDLTIEELIFFIILLIPILTFGISPEILEKIWIFDIYLF